MRGCPPGEVLTSGVVVGDEVEPFHREELVCEWPWPSDRESGRDMGGKVGPRGLTGGGVIFDTTGGGRGGVRESLLPPPVRSLSDGALATPDE